MNFETFESCNYDEVAERQSVKRERNQCWPKKYSNQRQSLPKGGCMQVQLLQVHDTP